MTEPIMAAVNDVGPLYPVLSIFMTFLVIGIVISARAGHLKDFFKTIIIIALILACMVTIASFWVWVYS